MNEWGLCGAALNFPEYAKYIKEKGKKAEVPSGLFLSFALGFCKSVDQLKDLLTEICISDESVNGIPATPLHWMFADADGCITVEPSENGLNVFENPYGILTNSPDFSYHTTRLADYVALHSSYPENRLTEMSISPYSRGMGAIGLPGDFSSSSRFIRGFFVKENSLPQDGEQGGINRMRHILSSVSIPLGCVLTRENEPVSTRYSCIMDSENLIYYFCSYDNPQLRSARLYPEATEVKAFSIYE
jgi:choloylglycine hydrolase